MSPDMLVSPLVTLAGLAIIEAVAYQWRIRAAVATCRWASAASCLAVCVARVAFVLAGASAVIAGTAWWAAVLAYAVPAAFVTWCIHGTAPTRIRHE